jgi:hypothetical protein
MSSSSGNFGSLAPQYLNKETTWGEKWPFPSTLPDSQQRDGSFSRVALRLLDWTRLKICEDRQFAFLPRTTNIPPLFSIGIVASKLVDRSVSSVSPVIPYHKRERLREAHFLPVMCGGRRNNSDLHACSPLLLTCLELASNCSTLVRRIVLDSWRNLRIHNAQSEVWELEAAIRARR